MTSFKKILVYSGGSDGGAAALARAATIAQSTGATVTVVRCVKELSSRLARALADRADGLAQTIDELEQDSLNALVENTSKSELSVKSRVLRGTPFIEVIRLVLAEGFDLVIKSAEQSNGNSSRLFGSTARHLIRKCPCPVWIVPPGKARAAKRVMAAVDVEHFDEPHQSLNSQILDYAAAVATADGAELHVASAWHFWVERYLRGAARVRVDYVEDLVETQEREAHHVLESHLSAYRVRGIPVELHFQKGDPETVIPSLAKELRSDVIVMGTFARSGLAGFFLGNTAEHILDQVDCSVLAIKPSGFQSPVHEIGEFSSDAAV